MNDGLLDPEFRRRLEALRRHLVSEARSGAAGEGAAPRRGSGAEFREHRAYAPGDDPRRIDWMAYARTGEPLVKLFRAEEDRLVRLVVDVSASLAFGDPSKMEVARRLAAGLGYLAMSGAERAQVYVARNEERGSGLSAVGAAHRGRNAFAALCRELSALEPSGSASLSRAVDGVLLRATHPGMLVVLSDFLDEGPVLATLARARAASHDVRLVQVLAPEELDPALEGDLALQDAETGSVLDVTVDASALTAYATRLQSLFSSLRTWAGTHGASYVRLSTRDDLEGAIRRTLSRSID